MLQAISLYRQMDRKHPALFYQLEKISDQTEQVAHMYTRGVPTEEHTLILALLHWRKHKIIFNLNDDVAIELLENTMPVDKALPIDEFCHLPYPAFAVSAVPFGVFDPKSSNLKNAFTGNMFVWRTDQILYVLMETRDGEFQSGFIDLTTSKTLNDCFDAAVINSLNPRFDVPKLKRLLDVEHFYELTQITPRHRTRIKVQFGENELLQVINAINNANYQEVMLSQLISILMFLRCDNVDIENAAERLKAGAESSLVQAPDGHISKTTVKAVTRELSNTTVFDVGYRIATAWRKQYSGNTEGEATGTGRKQGYGTRRGHFHHFWIGKRDAPIAKDIYNPLAGERGLRLHWVE